MLIEMQFLSCCYSSEAKIWKDDSQLGCACDPIDLRFDKKMNAVVDMTPPNLLFG